MSLGPSIKAIGRVLNRSSCGSCSVCGIKDDFALMLTNAHVAGTQLGRIVQVDLETTGDRIDARVVEAAYSNQTSTDWALLQSVKPYTKITPVKLSKKRPMGTHYTKGFPRCQAFAGTTITTVEITRYVWFWEPDAIGGQSGSGVWSHADNLQYGLLTWQWGGHGAGQPTAAIYEQSRRRTVASEPRRPGMIELPDNDFEFPSDINRDELEDPVVENGYYAEAAIGDWPIWAEDDPAAPPDPDKPYLTRGQFIEYLRGRVEYDQKWISRLETGTDSETGLF